MFLFAEISDVMFNTINVQGKNNMYKKISWLKITEMYYIFKKKGSKCKCQNHCRYCFAHVHHYKPALLNWSPWWCILNKPLSSLSKPGHLQITLQQLRAVWAHTFRCFEASLPCNVYWSEFNTHGSWQFKSPHEVWPSRLLMRSHHVNDNMRGHG